MKKVVVAGSRDFEDYSFLKSVLLDLYKADIDNNNLEVVCGMARGADMLGYKFAKEFGLPVKEMPADWETYGKSAGYRRNVQMAVYAKSENEGEVVAFWDGESRGTKMMIDIGRVNEMPVYIFNYEDHTREIINPPKGGD